VKKHPCEGEKKEGKRTESNVLSVNRPRCR
jgi:hypothetical protein